CAPPSTPSTCRRSRRRRCGTIWSARRTRSSTPSRTDRPAARAKEPPPVTPEPTPPSTSSASPGPTSDAAPREQVPNPLNHLLDVLRLERVGDGDGSAADPEHFRGESVHQPTGRVYGGQVLAQAVLAAGRTVPEGRLPHSLHGYFLRPGGLDV